VGGAPRGGRPRFVVTLPAALQSRDEGAAPDRPAGALTA
jgi:hypothetical protein